jgi:hypothetical protein
MAIVHEFVFPQDLPSVDRQIIIKTCLQEWAAEGYVADNDRSYLFKAGYENINDWDPDNIAIADGCKIAFVPRS